MCRHIFQRCEASAEAWGRHFENFREIRYVEPQKKTDSKFPTDAGLRLIKLRDSCCSRGHSKTDALYNHVYYNIIHSPSYFAKALPSSGKYHQKVVIKILERNIYWWYVLKFGNYYVNKLFTSLYILLCAVHCPRAFFYLVKRWIWRVRCLLYIILGQLHRCVPVLVLVSVYDSAFGFSVR
jgi:hypothetical protein